jgi:hypothetical protein
MHDAAWLVGAGRRLRLVTWSMHPDADTADTCPSFVTHRLASSLVRRRGSQQRLPILIFNKSLV